MAEERIYAAIDLKSFYASVECVERGLDPLRTNLVVADYTRTDKTICLAVSPPLKEAGVPGRPRLFEVKQKVREINRERQKRALMHRFIGKSYDKFELENSELMLDYIIAVPRMAYYMEYSSRIFEIYSRYVCPDDIHVYSIDEVFMDITNYVRDGGITPREFVMKLICKVLRETGITATAGIGNNMYLAKVAMDIVAKHMNPDRDGVRIAELDEMKYREALWDYTPITDFWRIGRGTAARLERAGIYTMGDIALCSVAQQGTKYNEEYLYREFGINAELIIDHAWGYEPCTIKDIKSYKPGSRSISSGQVLSRSYSNKEAAVIVREMADSLSLDLVEKGVVCDRVSVYIGYDYSAVKNLSYRGETEVDYYGRVLPKSAHGNVDFKPPTSSTKLITDGAAKVFERISDAHLGIRRINITACNIQSEREVSRRAVCEQIDLFSDIEEIERTDKKREEEGKKERRRQMAILDIKKKFGKNAILKGMNFEKGATAKERNNQIGGHKS